MVDKRNRARKIPGGVHINSRTSPLVIFALIMAFYFGQSACSRRSTQQPGPEIPVATATPSQTPSVSGSVDSSQGPQVSPSSAEPTASPGAGSFAQGSPADAQGLPAGTAPKPRTAGATSDSSIAEPPRPPRVFTLPAGSRISIFTTSGLSTKTAKPGDIFKATLASTIADRDWVIAKQGAPVEGVVLNSDPGGRVKGVASLTVALKRLTLADGRRVDLSTSSFTKKAPTTRKKDAAKIGIGAGVGALIGGLAGGRKGALIGAGAGGGAGTAYVLATRGDPAVIPDESHLTFRLNSPVKVIQRIP